MTTSSKPTIMRSSLKLQSLDDNSGLYEWNRKVFTLNIPQSTLCSSEDGVSKNEFSINGAVSAKEWTLSSPVAGYGFDLMWASGKIWSFLADDEQTCSQWVLSLNQSLSYAKDQSHVLAHQEIGGGRENDTTLRGSPLQLRPLSTNLTRDQFGSSGVEEYRSSPPHRASQTSANPFGSDHDPNVSAIPNVDSCSSGSSPQSDTAANVAASTVADVHHEPPFRSFAVEPILNIGHKMRPPLPPHVYHSAPRSSETAEEQTDGQTDASDDLRMKYFELQRVSIREKAATEAVKEQLVRVQDEMTARTSLLEDELKSTWEKYRADNQGIRQDIEKRLLRSESNSNSIHQAATTALREQHAREMSCLRDELAAERKRFSSLISREKTLLDESVAKENELRFELQTVRDGFQRLESEVVKLRAYSKQECRRWQEEKVVLLKDAERYLEEVTKDRDSLLLKYQEEVRLKVLELNDRFEGTVKDIEGSVIDTFKKEYESEKFRAIAQIQKQCTKDIEGVRAEERRNAHKESETTRNVFLDRERQTSDDLNHLEKLHATRVKTMEAKIEELNKKCEAFESTVQTISTKHNNKLSESKLQADSHARHLEEHARRGHVLGVQLREAHQEIQHSKHREAEYREKLSKAIEESRIQQAEVIELKRQAAAAAAQAYNWRRAAQNSDATHITERSALQIANDEILMLEHEVKRLREENWGLQNTADRAAFKIHGYASKLKVQKQSKTTVSPATLKAQARRKAADSANAASPSHLPFPKTHPYLSAHNSPTLNIQQPGWYPAGKTSKLSDLTMLQNTMTARAPSPFVTEASSRARSLSPKRAFEPDLSLTARYNSAHHIQQGVLTR